MSTPHQEGTPLALGRSRSCSQSTNKRAASNQTHHRSVKRAPIPNTASDAQQQQLLGIAIATFDMSAWRCLTTTATTLPMLLLGGVASHPVQPTLQAAEGAASDVTLLQEMGQPMCERPWSTACPIGRTCDREPVGFWCGQYDGDPDACVHQFEWQPSDDSLRPCRVETGCKEYGDECDPKRSRCTTGSSATTCEEPPWTTRGLLELQAVGVTLDADSNAEPAASSAAETEEECGNWTGLPEDETAEMQCGVLMYVHQPNAGSERMYSYFDQKARGDDTDTRNGWDFFNFQWGARRCAGQACFDGWDTKSEKWSILMQLVRIVEKPKLIVHLYNVFPGLGMGFLENAISPLQAQLEAKGCGLKLATTLREPSAHALAHALDNGIGSTATTLSSGAFSKFFAQWSNHQTKYLLLNKRLWPAALHENNATLDELLLPSAQDLLSRFGLVGRREEMPDFVQAVNRVLGWPSEWSLDDLGDDSDVDDDTRFTRPGMSTREAVGLVAAAHKFSKREMKFVKSTRLTDDALYRSFCDSASMRRRRSGKGVDGYASDQLRELLASVQQ